MARGLVPKKVTGAGYVTGGHSTFPIANAYATALYKGDPVVITAGYIVKAAATDNPIGVFMGTSYVDAVTEDTVFSNVFTAGTSNSTKYAPIDAVRGAKEPVAYVAQNPDLLMEIEADGAVTADEFGKNFDLNLSAGNASTGLSGATLDTSSVGTAATLMVRLEGLVEEVGNDLSSTSPRVLVKWVAHADRTAVV